MMTLDVVEGHFSCSKPPRFLLVYLIDYHRISCQL